MSSMNGYPDNWAEIAESVKAAASWKCIRCMRPHEPAAGYCLTVHHLDMDKANCSWRNLLPLCQRCHLSVQARVVIERPWMYEHAEWFKPYVAGYYAATYLAEELTRDEVMARLDELLELGRLA